MTLEEFTMSTKELEEFYGKELNYTQKKIWFDKLKYYAKDKYDNAIKSLCETSRYVPTLSQILEIIPHSYSAEKTQETVPCEACYETGYVLYNKIENGRNYTYACLCACQNAQGKEYDGTKIADKEHRSLYYIKTANEVFGDHIQVNKPNQEEKQRETSNMISTLTKQMSI